MAANFCDSTPISCSWAAPHHIYLSAEHPKEPPTHYACEDLAIPHNSAPVLTVGTEQTIESWYPRANLRPRQPPATLWSTQIRTTTQNMSSCSVAAWPKIQVWLGCTESKGGWHLCHGLNTLCTPLNQTPALTTWVTNSGGRAYWRSRKDYNTWTVPVLRDKQEAHNMEMDNARSTELITHTQ